MIYYLINLCGLRMRDNYNKRYYQKNKHKWKKYNNKRILDHYIVYYLPEHHYCGVTNSPIRRFSQHRADGNTTDNFRVLACADTLLEARAIEMEFHLMGMNGDYIMTQENRKL